MDEEKTSDEESEHKEEAEEEVPKEELEVTEAEKTAEEIEEAKPPLKEEAEEEIVEEKFYTIPLGKAWLMPPNKRAPKAMRIIRDFVKRHMKLEARKEEEEEEEVEPKRLIISNDVNKRVWSRGIEKPPRKIRIRAAKDKDGNVTVYLAEGD
ncbi:MAG: 50S ribosomal protein L31e [Candidatus Bathyarchaeota archaeon]|jgi:large subunit ribosomal protein L31e|nr:50S ribosomal protein L31e [Candidatus Bathyarchaeota archaeon A05DMB-3]MDH7606383.1 50S ribosomal protein L31e [Candidatus Bathyarchaeota archaeon]